MDRKFAYSAGLGTQMPLFLPFPFIPDSIECYSRVGGGAFLSRIAPLTPHRSVRAQLRHTALQVTIHSCIQVDRDARLWQRISCEEGFELLQRECSFLTPSVTPFPYRI